MIGLCFMHTGLRTAVISAIKADLTAFISVIWTLLLMLTLG